MIYFYHFFKTLTYLTFLFTEQKVKLKRCGAILPQDTQLKQSRPEIILDLKFS